MRLMSDKSREISIHTRPWMKALPPLLLAALLLAGCKEETSQAGGRAPGQGHGGAADARCAHTELFRRGQGAGGEQSRLPRARQDRRTPRQCRRYRSGRAGARAAGRDRPEAWRGERPRRRAIGQDAAGSRPAGPGARQVAAAERLSSRNPRWMCASSNIDSAQSALDCRRERRATGRQRFRLCRAEGRSRRHHHRCATPSRDRWLPPVRRSSRSPRQVRWRRKSRCPSRTCCG